jgi:hypothetical protein
MALSVGSRVRDELWLGHIGHRLVHRSTRGDCGDLAPHPRDRTSRGSEGGAALAFARIEWVKRVALSPSRIDTRRS